MSTELAPFESASADISVSSARAAVEGLNRGALTVFSTLPSETFDQKRAVLAAMNADSLDDQDMLGKPFGLTGYIAHVIVMEDEVTGAPREATRVVLIDSEGNSYAAISQGIMSSLERIAAMFGHPSGWPEPLPVQVNQTKTRKGFKVYTLDVL